MRLCTTMLLAAALLAASACAGDANKSPNAVGGARPERAQDGTLTSTSTVTAPRQGGEAQQSGNANTSGSSGTMTSMVGGGNAQAQPAPAERRIIRNATLSVELDDPAAGQQRIASLAEQHGGYVVTSESRQQSRGDDRAPLQVVTVEVRVPAAQFDAMLNAIRNLGGRLADEKVTGLDVTEEYIDLEARVRTQKALEAQIMEIMKRADTVTEALEVQTQLAAVRTEIERIEGRRRFLENQSSLSTIKVTLQPPAPFVQATTKGFLSELRSAFGDGVDFAAALLLGLVRVVIALTPVVLFIFLPLGLLVRYLLRRRRRRLRARQLVPEAPAESVK